MNYSEIIDTIAKWHDTGSQISNWDRQMADDVISHLMDLHVARWPTAGAPKDYKYDGIRSMPTDALAVLHAALFDQGAA